MICPFGRGRKFGTSMNKILDAFVGGWQVSGTYRQTSGLPYTVGNGSRWPTDWDVSANCHSHRRRFRSAIP